METFGRTKSSRKLALKQRLGNAMYCLEKAIGLYLLNLNDHIRLFLIHQNRTDNKNWYTEVDIVYNLCIIVHMVGNNAYHDNNEDVI